MQTTCLLQPKKKEKDNIFSENIFSWISDDMQASVLVVCNKLLDFPAVGSELTVYSNQMKSQRNSENVKENYKHVSGFVIDLTCLPLSLKSLFHWRMFLLSLWLFYIKLVATTNYQICLQIPSLWKNKMIKMDSIISTAISRVHSIPAECFLFQILASNHFKWVSRVVKIIKILK